MTNENIKMMYEIILAIIGVIAGVGIVIKVLAFKFSNNHVSIGKNIDNSMVESGATVNKVIGDNATLNVGTQLYYQDEEPQNKEKNTVWISGKELE